MVRSMQLKQKQTRGIFVPFAMRLNQPIGKGELVKMLKTKQVEKERVRGNLGEQIRLRTNTASLMCCGASSQSEVAIQIASQRVTSRFLPKNRNGNALDASIDRAIKAITQASFDPKTNKWKKMDTSWVSDLKKNNANVRDTYYIELSKDGESFAVDGDIVYLNGKKYNVQDPSAFKVVLTLLKNNKTWEQLAQAAGMTAEDLLRNWKNASDGSKSSIASSLGIQFGKALTSNAIQSKLAEDMAKIGENFARMMNPVPTWKAATVIGNDVDSLPSNIKIAKAIGKVGKSAPYIGGAIDFGCQIYEGEDAVDAGVKTAAHVAITAAVTVGVGLMLSNPVGILGFGSVVLFSSAISFVFDKYYDNCIK